VAEKKLAADAVRWARGEQESALHSDDSVEVSDDELVVQRQDVTVAGSSRGQRRCVSSPRLKLSEKVRLKLPKWTTEAADGVATHFADIDDPVFLLALAPAEPGPQP
jgi:hypothetical protein